MSIRNIKEYSIVKLEEADSTNAYALEHFDFFDDKTVIVAEKQTSGRGRYNRKWMSDDSSNLYITIVLKPKDGKNVPYANMTQYLSVILCRFLHSEFGINAQIKWPNDILVDGCKISGILAEASAKSNKIQGIGLGLGLNVNLKPETISLIDQKATSLFVLKNRNFDVDKIIEKILDMFFEGYEEFIKYGFKVIKDEYVSKCAFLGKEITIRENEKKIKYTALSVDEEGLLTVKDDNNDEVKIITGDVLC